MPFAIHKGPVAGVVADAITLNGHLQNPQEASVQLLQPECRCPLLEAAWILYRDKHMHSLKQ